MDILLIEDREEDAELTKLALESNLSSVDIHWLKDGDQALNYLFKEDNLDAISDLKLILLDVNLPKINGLELLKNLKLSSLKHIPVVMLTTSNQDSDIINAYSHYANSYILKPVAFQDFQEVVSNLANYWMNINVTQG